MFVTQVQGEAHTTWRGPTPTGATTAVGATRRHEQGKLRDIVAGYQNLRNCIASIIASIVISALIVIVLSDRCAAISPRYAARWPVSNGAEALLFCTI